VVLGHLKCLFLRNRGFWFSDKRSFEPLGRFEVFMKEFDSTPLRAAVGFWPRLSPRTGLLVFPLGTLPPVRLLPARPRVLCSLFGCLDASSTDRLLGGADAVVSPVTFDVAVVGYCGEVILKGVGAGFPMTLGSGAPCVRAGHHCHAEALSEAGINTSPRLFGMDVKHLCVTVCVVYTFSDLGIVVLGHLKRDFRK
jgi:hypothetical protein